jgi:hypothetical protein
MRTASISRDPEVPKRFLNCISDDQDAIESAQINGATNEGGVSKSETSPFCPHSAGHRIGAKATLI